LRGKHDEEMKIAVRNWFCKRPLRFTKLQCMPSFEIGLQLWNAMATMMRNSNVNLWHATLF